MIAEVIIETTAKQLNRTFDYNIPAELEEYVTVGSTVLVQFGRKKELEEAYVVGIKEKTENAKTVGTVTHTHTQAHFR